MTKAENVASTISHQSVRSAVVLFDIDGTLITSGGAARAALISTLESFLGEPGLTLDFSFAGMTDRSITRRAFTARGRGVDDATIDAFLAAYLPMLERTIEAAPRYAVHPGMVAALRAIQELPRVALGLGTGNVEAGARIKLARVGLDHFFSFGGFGCDAEARAELIAAGITRGAQKLGVKGDEVHAVIVGDTPSDVAAAHANDALCFAVATGGATAEALAASGADAVFSSLESKGALTKLLAMIQS